ncbi:glycoside hydrolase 43 family protein [Hymenobacter ginsengisoli]|uniref:Glycoside hydrolase 43 family protein n=1 Tax=Hymenobacter ginsengisoli TaxID=1051626 RepID=A0ABP8QCV0_9BACT|nr:MULTISPECIES: glycoside hydrolase 43 family protein [unclassified Hymenobacter]MBO2031943.1 glycoside hydrolase 43 family protein [Hymenobacter sp. BT559]
MRLFSLFFALVAAGWAAAVSAQTLAPSAPWVPDLGNGQYKNPVLYADYSDPDVVRVGADYYLTSSSFNMAPGLPILHSKDLVNWTIIGHALPVQPPASRYDHVQPGNGVWAPALRYHAGKFYLYYPDPDLGIFVTTATNPAGPWTAPVCVKAAKGWIDPCPLWDEDGRAYLVHAFAGSRAGIKSVIHVSEMAPNGLSLLGEDKLVFDGHAYHPTIEGPKFYKRHGYYYIFAPGGGVPQGWQVALRSKNVFGPYEDKIVLAQGKSPVNGPHQGAWVDTPDGRQDWFLHFQDQNAYGRVVHLQPMTWQNNWPVMGLDADGDGTGEPVLTYRKPVVPGKVPLAVPATSDEFASGKPGLQWQWQANSQPQWLASSAAAKPGQLALAAVPAPVEAKNLYLVPNLLLQKLPAEHFTATAKLSGQGLAAGDRAGLVVLGMDYATLSLTRQADGRLALTQTTCPQADKGAAETTTASAPPGPSQLLYLRLTVRAGARCQFSYSPDGKLFSPLGPEFVAREGKWVGAKMGLFCLSASAAPAPGYVGIDWWHVAP